MRGLSMNHTFLLQPTTWQVTGTYSSASKKFSVIGTSTIIHYEQQWIVESSLKLDNGIAMQNDYTVVPIKNNHNKTTFFLQNPFLGKLIGTFELHGTNIIEQYHTEDHQFEGKEIMIMLDSNHYTCQGTMYNRGDVKSTWILDMVLKESVKEKVHDDQSNPTY